MITENEIRNKMWVS